MKKYFYFLFLALLSLCYSCSDSDSDGYKTYTLSFQLEYPSSAALQAAEDVVVTLTDMSDRKYTAKTDANGKAVFIVTSGVYSAAVSDVRSAGGSRYTYNGSLKNIAVTSAWDNASVLDIELEESVANQVIIKELYVGGCLDNENKVFHMDKYVILYNNSDQQASLDNLCLGMMQPWNSNLVNKDEIDGKFRYELGGWIPAANGIWYYPRTLVLEPGEQIVIALNNAVDNTATYPRSVDLGKAGYHCTYDIEDYSNTKYYSVPSSAISKDNYWSAVRYGNGNAWSISTSSPAFYIFRTDGISAEEFASNGANIDYYGGTQTLTYIQKKVPQEWVVDAIEVFTTKYETNYKRLTNKLDMGHVKLTNGYGYSSYRNVDVEATKAIEGNEAKLVYGYNKGTEVSDVNNFESTDPSGIDAEASIRNGARIIYKDTNNSTNDFHQRKQASLKD